MECSLLGFLDEWKQHLKPSAGFKHALLMAIEADCSNATRYDCSLPGLPSQPMVWSCHRHVKLSTGLPDPGNPKLFKDVCSHGFCGDGLVQKKKKIKSLTATGKGLPWQRHDAS